MTLTPSTASMREPAPELVCRSSDELGVTSVEYALIGILVAIAIIGGAVALGDSLSASYEDVSTQFSSVMR